MLPEGVTFGRLLTVVAIGFLVGYGVDSLDIQVKSDNEKLLAMSAGFIATLVAAVARNTWVCSGTPKIPWGVVITFAVIAALSGSLLGYEIIYGIYSDAWGPWAEYWGTSLASLPSSLLTSVGSLLGYEITYGDASGTWPDRIGRVAGTFSSLILSILIITFYVNPRR